MSKHTPGPWNVDSRASARVVDNSDTTIASAGMASRILEEAQANAILIAAAPEMYEALKVMANEIYDCDCKSCKMARAAIAKAEGKG